MNIDEKKYKFGISQYIKDRINSHKRELDFNNIVKIWTMHNFDNIKKLEKKVKNLIKQWEIQYNEDNQLEWFQVNDNVSLQDVTNKIDQYMETTDVYSQYIEEKDNLFFDKWRQYKEQRLNSFQYKPHEWVHFDNRIIDLEKYKFEKS